VVTQVLDWLLQMQIVEFSEEQLYVGNTVAFPWGFNPKYIPPNFRTRLGVIGTQLKLLLGSIGQYGRVVS